MKPALALAGALLLAGCGGGGPPADIFVVEREGSVEGAQLTLRLTDDGGAYCNDIGRRELTSDQLIEARALRRELDGERDEDGLAARGLRLGPGRRTIFSFRVRSEDGTISFYDTSPNAPEALPKLVKLTRDVARGPCGLER